MMAFIWIALVYVSVAFTDITAGTFVAGDESLVGETTFQSGRRGRNGERALSRPLDHPRPGRTSSSNRRFGSRRSSLCRRHSRFRMSAHRFSHVLIFSHQTWAVTDPALLRCRVAAAGVGVAPAARLSRRFCALRGDRGRRDRIFFGGYSIQQPAFKSFDVGGMTGMLFPFLFVTIACGACSGFHGLVCSGTTSKQIDKESHTHPIGYGGMLAEGFVAFIALVTVMIAASDTLVGPDGRSLCGRQDLRQRHR